MSETAIQAVDAKDRLIAQLQEQVEALERANTTLKNKLTVCQEQRTMAIASKTPVSYMRAIEAARQQQDDYWQADMETLIDSFQVSLALERLMRDVDVAAVLYTKDNGDELRNYVTENTVGDIGKYLATAAALLDSPLNGIRERANARMSAITALTNNRDDGTQLRDLAKQTGGFTEYLADWRDALKLAGSEKGKRNWSTEIARKIAHYVDEEHKAVADASRLAVEYFLALPVDHKRRNDPAQQARIQIKKWNPEAREDRARGHYYDWLKTIDASKKC